MSLRVRKRDGATLQDYQDTKVQKAIAAAARDAGVCMADADTADIRRSAMICLFSLDDGEMLNAKTGEWYREWPEYQNANISVMLKRDEAKKAQFRRVFRMTRQWGEPGFYFTNDYNYGANPRAPGACANWCEGAMVNLDFLEEREPLTAAQERERHQSEAARTRMQDAEVLRSERLNALAADTVLAEVEEADLRERCRQEKREDELAESRRRQQRSLELEREVRNSNVQAQYMANRRAGVPGLMDQWRKKQRTSWRTRMKRHSPSTWLNGWSAL